MIERAIHQAIENTLKALYFYTDHKGWQQSLNTRTNNQEDRLFFSLEMCDILEKISFGLLEKNDLINQLRKEIQDYLHPLQTKLSNSLEKVMYHALVSTLPAAELNRALAEKDYLIPVIFCSLMEEASFEQECAYKRAYETICRMEYERYQITNDYLVNRKIHNSFNILSPFYILYRYLILHQKIPILTKVLLQRIEEFVGRALVDLDQLTCDEIGFCLLLANDKQRAANLSNIVSRISEKALYSPDNKPFIYYLDYREGAISALSGYYRNRVYTLTVLLYGLVCSLDYPFHKKPYKKSPPVNRAFLVGKYALSTKGKTSLQMKSNCMKPILSEGDIIEIRPITEVKATPGCILVFRNNDRILAHRVEKVFNGMYVTRSLKMDSFLNYPVFPDEILGIVTDICYK